MENKGKHADDPRKKSSVQLVHAHIAKYTTLANVPTCTVRIPNASAAMQSTIPIAPMVPDGCLHI